MVMLIFQAGETFNRLITRKKLLCRSRAVQISRNLSELEEWIMQVGLPKGVQSHFVPVRDLLNWLQVREFIDLVLSVLRVC